MSGISDGKPLKDWTLQSSEYPDADPKGRIQLRRVGCDGFNASLERRSDEMSDFFILAHAEARKRAAARCMEAPDGYTVKFSLPKRSNDQNALLHALIFEFAAQYEHCGKKWDGDDMKRILVDQLRRDTIKDPEIAPLWESMGIVEMAPSFDGTGVVMLGAQTRKFPLKLASIMIEWLYALGVELNIKWSE